MWSWFRRNLHENVKIWKKRLSIFCTFYCNYLRAWRPKDSNVTLMSFLCLFTETITTESKVFSQISWQILSKLTKSVRNCQHHILWRNSQNWNLSFRKFLLKYEPCIKDKEPHDKEQKIYTTLFLRFKRTFTQNFFIKLLTKGNS